MGSPRRVSWQIAPPLPFIPEERHGDVFCAFVACWTGPLEEGESVLKPFHDIAPVVAEHVGPMPYPPLNGAFDALLPAGLQQYWKANFLTELSDEQIDAQIEWGTKVPTIKANYRGNYERLVEIKRKYDPGNLFHLNQNIKT